jgi:hypothetical protein
MGWQLVNNFRFLSDGVACVASRSCAGYATIPVCVERGRETGLGPLTTAVASTLKLAAQRPRGVPALPGWTLVR